MTQSPSTTDEQVIRQLWQHFGDENWRAAEGLLAPELLVEWPQSRERIIGPKNYIAVNEHYGGKHRFNVLRVASQGRETTSEVYLESDMPDGRTLKLFVVSFFELCDATPADSSRRQIFRAREYWADTYAAPENRKQWTQSD